MSDQSPEGYIPKVNGLTKRHEEILMRLKEEGASDELIREVARGLKSDRMLIAKVGIDGLTELPQAGLCQEKINSYLTQGIPVSIEFNDLLYLKTFNEEIGHERTNNLLKEIAAIFKAQQELYKQKGIDVNTYRYAGDEFVTIIPGLDREKAREVAEEIHKNLAGIPKPEGAPIKAHFSRGQAFSGDFPENKRNFRNLIDFADTQAKDHKMKIRHRLESFSPQLTANLRRYG